MRPAPDPRPLARTPRGFNDRRSATLASERRIIEAVARIYESYGFEALDTGALEYADALGKFLPDADRPNEGVFALADDDGEWMALRYDLTAPLARFVAQNGPNLPKPFRRYAVGSVWRNEKPGPGRYREFVQCDADTVGSTRPEADAEMVALAIQGYRAAGLPAADFVLRINNRKLLNGLLTAAGVTAEGQRLAVLRAVDKLDRLGMDGVERLLAKGRLDESGAFTRGAELQASAIERVLAFISASGAGRGETLSRIAAVIGGSAEGERGLQELGRIAAALDAFGVDDEAAKFDPSVVRGLEYYTGPVFEAELMGRAAPGEAPARFGSIGGGGRYDDLVARFTGEPVPATGFSFGVSRLVAALEASAAEPAETRGPVVVIAFDQAGMAEYLAAAAELRAAGFCAEVYLGEAGMRAQMRYADRRLSPAAVILGGDEIAAGQVTVKDLDLGRELAQGVADNRAWRLERPGQVTAPRGELVGLVRAIVERGR